MSHAYHAAAITCNYRKPSFDTHAMFDSYKSGYTESSRGGGGGVYPTHPDDDNNIPERYRPEKLNFDKPPLLATPPLTPEPRFVRSNKRLPASNKWGYTRDDNTSVRVRSVFGIYIRIIIIVILS